MSTSWKLLRRLAISVAGLIVLLVGVVMLVAPGPGFLVIALGLLILSVEYEWARRHLDRAKSHARTLADKAAANRLSTAISTLFALGIIGDLLAGQRVMTQRVYEKVRRIELELDVEPSHRLDPPRDRSTV